MIEKKKGGLLYLVMIAYRNIYRKESKGDNYVTDKKYYMDKRLKYFVFVASVFAVANFGLSIFLILIASKITGGVFYPLLLYILFNLIFAVFVVPSGKISDKIGRKKVLLLGYVLFFLVALSFIFLNNLAGVAFLFIIYGLVYAITNANHRAFVADLSDDMKGTEMGFYYFVTGIVTIPAGLIAGVLWNISPQTMFFYIFGVAVVSLILLGFVKRK